MQISSPLIRTSIFGDLSNASRTGATSRLAFNARAGVTYRRYQSDNPDVQNFSNAWMPTAGLALSLGGAQFGFGIADTFARLEDPPYNAAQLTPITRIQQSGIGGRPLGAGRRPNHGDAALHEHGRHLRGHVLVRLDRHQPADARRGVEVAAEDRDLRERSARASSSTSTTLKRPRTASSRRFP